jgi:cyclohexadieny/prephenate dehydrogenase
MIRNGDAEGLFDLFIRTRAIRRGIIEQGQETAISAAWRARLDVLPPRQPQAY